jgi:diacylglycerol kinase family enzyme
MRLTGVSFQPVSQRLRPGERARLEAALALLLLATGLAAAIVSAVDRFPLDLIAVLMLSAALVLAMRSVFLAGPNRIAGLGLAALLALGAFLLMLASLQPATDFAAIACAVGGVWLTRKALRHRASLAPAPRPKAAVVFWNPKSGGGKAAEADLEREARARGIKPVELGPGDDLTELVRDAIASGADALAAAGGDGTQATVAALAAESDIPFACIPAGTRNHFALDLGVDREDLIGSLDALVDGGEKRVDLGEVNDRPFVNNVSLGLYAEAVQADGYRDAKIRTLIGTASSMADNGGDGERTGLKPSSSGREVLAVLVSNNRYRIGRAIGSGMRPRIDDGLLGVTVFEATDPLLGGGLVQRPWRQWETRELTLTPDGSVPAGIDGEATELDSPVRFRILPGVLRVRIARSHPGASPAARLPDRFTGIPQALWVTATGRG